jgi:hypothetical protein
LEEEFLELKEIVDDRREDQKLLPVLGVVAAGEEISDQLVFGSTNAVDASQEKGDLCREEWVKKQEGREEGRQK